MIGPRLRARPVPALRTAHLDAARRATGLDDFGPDDFLEPLDIMLDDLVHRSRLSPRGHLLTPYYLQRLLRLRLRVWHAVSVRPRHVPARPVFVLGLPRTGSTLLHEVLALHPSLRAPTFWECHALPHGSSRDRWSQAFTRTQVATVNLLAPDLRRVHPLSALGPHECVSIQALTFRSMQFHAAYRLPGYDAWMRDSFDWQPAYTWHEQHLGMLGDTATRWVLKAPAHMLGIKALLKVYTDARFIVLHRDPLEVMPSMASLTLTLRRLTSRQHNLREIGHDVNALWHKGLHAFMQARDSHPSLETRIMDVPYTSLVRDPQAALRRICTFLDTPCDDAFVHAVDGYLGAHPKDRHGTHRYTLGQFGLDAGALREAYGAYVDRFVASDAG